MDTQSPDKPGMWWDVEVGNVGGSCGGRLHFSLVGLCFTVASM